MRKIYKVLSTGFVLFFFIGSTSLFFADDDRTLTMLILYVICCLITVAFLQKTFNHSSKNRLLASLQKMHSAFLILSVFLLFVAIGIPLSFKPTEENISAEIMTEDITGTTDTSEDIIKKAEEEKKQQEENEKRKQENEKRKQEIEIELNEKLSNLPFEYDNMAEATYLHNSYLENYTNRYQFYPYLATSVDINNENFSYNSSLSLFLRVSYEGDDWLFVDSMTIKTDTQKYDLFWSLDNRDNDGGRVWEWLSLKNKEINIEMLEDMMNSSSTTIRLRGSQYYDDRELTYNEKEALKQIIPIYNLYLELQSL